MAITNILTEINRSDTFPKVYDVSAPNLSGSLTLKLGENYTEQMLHELPALTFDVYTLVDGEYSRYTSVSVTMITWNKDIPYTIPIYSLPKTFKLYVTPNFDRNAIASHENLCITEKIENTWSNLETQVFPVEIFFDNAEVKGGGGTGGGGSDDPEQREATETISIEYKLLANNWVGNKYTIVNEQFKDSTIDIFLTSGVTESEYDAAAYAKIACESSIGDTIVLVAFGVVPTIDIPVTISYTGYNEGGMIDVVTITKWAEVTVEDDRQYIIIDDIEQ